MKNTKLKNQTECCDKFNELTEKIESVKDSNEDKLLRQMRRKVLNKYVQTIRCGWF